MYKHNKICACPSSCYTDAIEVSSSSTCENPKANKEIGLRNKDAICCTACSLRCTFCVMLFFFFITLYRVTQGVSLFKDYVCTYIYIFKDKIQNRYSINCFLLIPLIIDSFPIGLKSFPQLIE